MSVKDKIAMWNSMASNPNPPPATSNKLAASDTHLKPKQQEIEKKAPINQPIHPVQEHIVTPPIGVTCNFKKTESIEQPAQVAPPPSVKPPNLAQKPKEIIKPIELQKAQNKEQSEKHVFPASKEIVKPSQVPKPVKKEQTERHTLPTANLISKPTEVQKQEKKEEAQRHSVPTFQDIKKQLEAQTAGKGIYFAPPAIPSKKVEVIGGSTAVECEIEKEVPRGSVKEQAAKLAQFYEQKRINELKKNQEKAQKEALQYQKEHEVVPTITQHQANTLNINPPHQAVQLQTHVEKQQAIKPENAPADIEHSPINLNLRNQNKNKMKKQHFESDED